MKKPRQTFLLLFLISCISFFVAPSKVNSEPLFKNNGFPFLYNVLNPFPEYGEISENKLFEFRSSIIVENTMRYFKGRDGELFLDLEARRVPIEVRINPFKRIQLSFNVQYVYLTGGFTDILISKTHQLFHLSGRKEHANSVYYYLKAGEKVIFDISGRSKGWSDPFFGLKINLLKSSDYPIGISFKLLYKKPLKLHDSIFDSDDDAFGGVFFFDTKFKKLTFSLNIGRVITGDSNELKPVTVDDFFFGYLIAEYQINDRFRTLLQLSVMQSPFRENPLTGLKEPPCEFLIGMGYQINEHAGFELGFSQDLTVASPEFGVNLGLRYGF